nr:reverse transcriptase domain-containing protein [Tanacetum cinerariifolium]
MKYIQTFLKKFNRVSFRETPKVLSEAWDKFFEIQHAQPEDTHELLRKLLEDLQIINKELAEYINSLSLNRPSFYEDDDEHSIQYKEYLENSSNAITPILPTKELDNSLSMGDEHLSTISETKSDEVIKSCVENLVPIPSEFDDFSDNEKSLLNQDILMISYPKINSFLEEFSGELTHIDLVPPGISKADFDPEEEISLIEELDSDSHMEEIDLFLATDDLMPSGIEYDDYDSERDIHFLKSLLSDDPFPLPKNKSSNFDHHDDLSFPRPPSKPPDVEIFLDFEPDAGVLTTKVVKGISERYVLMPNILPTLPTLHPDLEFTPSYDSFGSENKIFDLGIFIEVQPKRLLSWEEFSVSFICDPLYPVFDTLLSFIRKRGQNVQTDKEKSLREIRCLKTLSKFVRYSMYGVEAKALPTNDSRVVVKLLKSLFSRFGIPWAIISDRGTHFCNDQFTRVMIKYGVTHRLATAYHPQMSGQVENFPMIDDEEVLQAREKFMKSIQTFLQKFSRDPFGVVPKVLLIAWERFSEIKHAFIDKQYQPEEIQELMSKLLGDVQNINEELYDYTNSLSWNCPIFYDNDEHSREYLEKSSKAITPVLPTKEPEYSISMRDEHLSTISETESDEVIKSSVKNLS